MKTFVIAAALCCAAVQSEAACTTAALAGTWRLVSETGYCDATVSQGGAISGACGAGWITLNSACKATGKIRGYGFEGRTEAIASTSSLKPNHIVGFGAAFGGLAGYRR